MVEIKSEVEQLFVCLNECAELVKEELNITYLEALAEAGEFLYDNGAMINLTPSTKKHVQERVSAIDVDSYQAEHIRKAIQLAVLKGMKEATQPHHALTPDAVALFISYLVNKLQAGKKNFSLLDPAIGTANLVSAVVNQSPSLVATFGFEVDETLLKVAYVSANLQQSEIQLFHEDSIRPVSLPEIDMVVSDLPVGFYPNEEIADQYVLKAKEGKSFLQHLMIERTFQVVKPGGYMVFIVPNFLFESEEAPNLHQFLKNEGIVLGLLQLPASMFKDAKYGKSVLLLQKKGEDVKTPRQALLAELPSFSNKDALSDMMRQIDKWFKEQLRL
ncbi:class I SAM-dependent methyltransferase [Bacillus alkalicellulosilyticus]|uniref:class I SAM-dependent methyltransferase n=1 Tax=Alkalihalobacterium alkalicellulosilyticum TaxID=1912214 RepID=UPI000997553D|nr:class I SAM-dependent methyltransferase [Bacillus alkalicellulosilyticus]